MESRRKRWFGRRSRLRERGPELDRERTSPHEVLDQPVAHADPTEWPDPYEQRPDPRDQPGPPGEARRSAPGAVSTSEPHPRQDPEAIPAEAPERERLDE